MDAGKIEELRAFVNVCNSNPSIFDDPSLAFFKDFVHRFFSLSLSAYVYMCVYIYICVVFVYSFVSVLL